MTLIHIFEHSIPHKKEYAYVPNETDPVTMILYVYYSHIDKPNT